MNYAEFLDFAHPMAIIKITFRSFVKMQEFACELDYMHGLQDPICSQHSIKEYLFEPQSIN